MWFILGDRDREWDFDLHTTLNNVLDPIIRCVCVEYLNDAAAHHTYEITLVKSGL